MGDGGTATRQRTIVFAGVAAWLLLIAFVRKLSIDESQYVAATALVGRGLLPYRDFAYLQTPLQPFVFAPLHWLFAGHLLLAMRLTNSLLGLATIGLVFAAARRAGSSEGGALAAAAMLATCEAFTWCAGVARNDMLPAALMMCGIWLLMRERSSIRSFAAGTALGLAASAKISYAVPAAAMFVAGAMRRDRREQRLALSFAAGVTVGLLPTIILALIAPGAFWTEALLFPAAGPTQYYTDIGKAWRLGPNRFLRLLIAAAIGPALIAAIAVVRRSAEKPRDWIGDPRRRMLLAASFGGLVSAALNKPFQIFYLLPALPPLFVLLASIFSETRTRPLWLKGIWAASVFAGTVPVAAWVVHAAQAGIVPALDEQRRAAALGDALRSQGVKGPVGTLATDYLSGARAAIDPRFASGPFLYRTRNFISVEDAVEWHVVTRDQAAALVGAMPDAIVTGIYPDFQAAQEEQLAAQARALGYRPVGGGGGFTIWRR